MSDLNNIPTTIDEDGNEILNEFEYTDEEKAEIEKLNKKADSDNEDEDNDNELDDDFVEDLLKNDEEDEEDKTDESNTPPSSEDDENQDNDDELDPGTKTDNENEVDDKENGQNDPLVEDEVEPLPNFDEQLEELDQQRQAAQGKVSDAFSKLEELGEQFDNGEIGQGKYDTQKALLEREIRQYEGEVSKLDAKYEALSNTAAETIDAYNKSQADKFNQELLNFVKKEENNYLMTNPNLAGEFDQLLKAFGNAGVFDGMSNIQIIETVNNTLLVRHPELKTVRPKSKADPEQKIEKNAKPPKPKHENPKIPTSLSNIPAVEVNDQTDPFAHIRKLSGIEYEAAIQSLTPKQYQQFFGEEFLDH
ncbi:Uncharacterised protein [Acinetobacter baumannii]|uniref:hypothetical protein n=1 Tax=Acinetobacter calcoaceticus/baumannii complex TaxID=909768 RepID=UPI000E125637|nr:MULTISPECIES: hypothetical protein [Acinetobacter calcoaceticus/baumannii complex]MBF6887871.1 hypothetical protein [Acinetobacter baumannii]MDA5045165.1 hypothetical protein [Acinetobacter baumannii]MDC5259411.1 hypothetical protein [Acinetobacter baumannii]CAA0276524.1 hypothetical protein ABKPCSM125_03707 [Acinetobacter baumannii]SUV72947.1 Uncharacterised protein [Acinetobacter baumannii]